MATKIKYASTTKASPQTLAEQYVKDGELPKWGVAEVREKLREAYDYINKFKNLGYCRMCDTYKSKDKFYYDTDPEMKTEYVPVCKECLRKVAHRVDENGQEHEPTKESCMHALRLMNKPFLNVVWDASVQESENLVTGKARSSVWLSMVKNVQMKQYVGLTWADSDIFKGSEQVEPIFYSDERDNQDEYQLSKLGDNEANDFQKNKADVNRLLGYLPYEQESIEDQVQLYAQLIGMIDGDGDENDDMVRNQSCISICRGFLQASKIDNAITNLMADVKDIESNSASIKSLQASKKDIMSQITSLAAESQISLKNQRNRSRGDNTWTGKVKRIRDMNIADVNGFDIKTCKGMQQVLELSDASIMKQLALDDSEWSDMVAEMRTTNRQLYGERDAYQEINRILLKENLDLRDTLEENNLLDKSSVVNLMDIYSPFSDMRDNEEELNPPLEEKDGEQDV